MDGADSNRQFIKLHFHERDPVQDNFVTANLYTGRPMVFIMDPKVLSSLAISLNYVHKYNMEMVEYDFTSCMPLS